MTAINFNVILHRYWYILLIFFAVPIFFLIAIKIVNSLEYQNSDFFSFWLAGYLALLGKNPYLADIWIAGRHQFGSDWIPETSFLYPLPLSLFFAPLGLLSLYQAYVLWVTLSQLMVIFSVAILLRSNFTPLIKPYILPLLAGVVLFRPLFVTLINGQLSGFLLFVTACVVYFWKKGKWWQGCALLPILALKPNLGIPIILLLSFYLILQKRINCLFVTGASGFVILFVGFIQNSNWIIEYWRVGNTKLSQTFGYSPTIWGLANRFCNYEPNCTINYGGGVCLLLLIGFIYIVARKRRVLSPTFAVSLSVTVTLLITPYTWPYDQLLLVIPIIAVTMGLVKAGYRFLPTAIIFLIIDLLALMFLYICVINQSESWNAATPLSVLCLLTWYLTSNRVSLPENINLPPTQKQRG